MIEPIEIDGVKTHIRKMIFQIRSSDVCICPLCRKIIQPKDKIYLLINNYKLFPNIIIHDECVLDNENILPILDWENTIKKLKEDYKQAEQVRKHNICWFGS